MKLKQPITITIETVEEAICIYHRLNVGIGTDSKISHVKPWQLELMRNDSHDVWKQTRDALKQAGIDPNQQPPQPLLILGEPATANADGSVNMLRGVVPRSTIEAVWKLSSEAMWPKYYVSSRWNGSHAYVRFDSEEDCYTVSMTGANEYCNWKWKDVETFLKGAFVHQITHAQAAAILEGKR